jgi:hypothetical protein
MPTVSLFYASAKLLLKFSNFSTPLIFWFLSQDFHSNRKLVLLQKVRVSSLYCGLLVAGLFLEKVHVTSPSPFIPIGFEKIKV